MSKPVKLPSGTWRIRWLDHLGQRRSEAHKTYKSAQRALTQHRANVDEVKAHRREPEPVDRRFEELIEYWLTRRAIRKRSIRHDRSIIGCHLRPAFGRMLVREITVERIDEFMAARAHLSPKTVNNLVTLLLTMLNVAVALDWLIKVPRVRKHTIRLFDRDYRYLRNDDEVRRFLTASREDGEDAYVMYATAILTGMRQGELAALQWSDVDFEKRLIIVQRSFTGPTKGGDVRYVPLLDGLLPILRAWKLKCGGGWLVFPNEGGNMHQNSARLFQERLHRILDSAGFPRPPAGARAVHYITFHCFRHTFASQWVMKGGDLFKLQKILGHKSIQMTMRYAHLQPAAYAEDHDRLAALVIEDGGEVVDLMPPMASERAVNE